MKTSDFDYDLPEERIAQAPCPVRDACRMLVMDRYTGELQDKIFRDIYDYIQPGDLLVANETRVLPARLLGAKRGTGGAAEVLLLKELMGYEPKQDSSAVWSALVRPGKRLKPGAVIDFTDAEGNVALSATVLDWGDGSVPLGEGAQANPAGEGVKGGRVVRLSTERASLDDALHAIGHTPLPPYIRNYAGDEEMYQTVYSMQEEHSAAAPTAGLHFTPELIERIKEKGARFETVELQVGIDTFRVVDEEDCENHEMHTETYTVPQRVVDAIAETKAAGGRVIAVGTTSVRSLESAWDAEAGCMKARENATTNLFLLPGSTFHVVDALVTNFHVPRSTLMMLVSAFSSRDFIMNAYQHAINNEYRMLSFGDAMFIQ